MNIFDAMFIRQSWTIDLGILEDDGSRWVRRHKGKGFFHALKEYFNKWTLKNLANHENTLKAIGIYDVVWAFKGRLELANKDVMRANMEMFWPTTHTFVTPNGELGFFLKEISEITGLPVMGDIYEEFFPMDSELGGEDGLRALFIQLLNFRVHRRH